MLFLPIAYGIYQLYFGVSNNGMIMFVFALMINWLILAFLVIELLTYKIK